MCFKFNLFEEDSITYLYQSHPDEYLNQTAQYEDKEQEWKV
jgi:hypothetical protein